MLVYDVYKIVVLENKNISTAKFFSYLNEGINELTNAYAGAEDNGAYSDLYEEMKLNDRFKYALSDYIIAMSADNADIYNRFISEYINSAVRASFAAGRGKKGRIFVPKFR